MRRTWHKAKPKEEKNFRSNRQITNPEIILITENGENIGKIRTEEALRMAMDAEMDLVEVNPKGDAPVCKIMDYGQFKYEQDKKSHKQKVAQKKVDTKTIKLSVRIGQHDFDLRLAQSKKFLERGDKIKVELGLKGREKAHPDVAVETINNFISALMSDPNLSVIKEQDLTRQGGRFNITLLNKK